MIKAVDKHIPASLRMDYLKITNDIYVAKQRRQEVVDTIKEILEEHGHEDEDR